MVHTYIQSHTLTYMLLAGTQPNSAFIFFCSEMKEVFIVSERIVIYIVFVSNKRLDLYLKCDVVYIYHNYQKYL